MRSEANPAYAPSRDRPVPAPWRERPAWLNDVAAGSFDRFDAVVAGGCAPCALGFWTRLLLLLGGAGAERDEL